MIIFVKSFYLFEATIEHFVILSVSCLQCRHRFCLWDKQWKCKPLVLQILSLYVRSQPAVATHPFIQLVELRQKLVELNRLGRHRCLHSFSVTMAEKGIEKNGDEENEFSIISCCCWMHASIERENESKNRKLDVRQTSWTREKEFSSLF